MVAEPEPGGSGGKPAAHRPGKAENPRQRGPIGILGLQGDFAAHGRALAAVGADTAIVKQPQQLDAVGGLILPGGESTTLIKLMDAFGFWEPLRAFIGSGRPVFGTCAGLILLAAEVVSPPQKSLAAIDVTVERNSYGRQRESFEAVGTFAANGRDRDLPMVFIRAPRILRLGAGVEPLAHCRGEVVMARSGNVLAASFHPELTPDSAVHRYFAGMAAGETSSHPG